MAKPTRLSYVGACMTQGWHLELRKRDGSDPSLLRVPFRCRSWRHAGDCREWCGACDFVRCQKAILENPFWTYMVFTYPKREWPLVSQLFRFGVVSWARMRKRIQREFGSFKYIQTWEVHKSGYPHVNVVVSNQALHAAAEATPTIIKQEWLEPALVECGFGKISHLEPMKDGTRMAGYLVKMAKELTGATVKNQIPVNAPKGFRRLRASKGLLEPRHRPGEYTGRIVPCPLTALQADGEIVNADVPPWLQERLEREVNSCLVQAPLPFSSK